VLALAASPAGLVIAIDRGLFRLDRGAWKPIAAVPGHVAALLSDRWATVEHGVIDLRNGKTVAWPVRSTVSVVVAVAEDIVVGIAGTDLMTLRAGKVTLEPIPLAPGSAVVGLVADRDGHVVAATRDGDMLVKDRGTWTTTMVRDELPPPRPGSPPALSR
jgi:hypothetical protein